MSGPKGGHFITDSRTAQNIKKRLECESNSNTCYNSIASLIKKLSANLSSIDRMIGNANLLKKRTSDSGLLKKLTGLKAKLEAEIEALKAELKYLKPRSGTSFVSDAIYRQMVDNLKKLKDLKKRADGSVRQFAAEVGQAEAGTVEAVSGSIIDDISAPSDKEPGTVPVYGSRGKDAGEIGGSIVADIISVSSFDVEKKDAKTVLEEKKETVGQTLKDLLKGEPLSAELVAEIGGALKALKSVRDEKYLQMFRSVTVGGLSKKAAEYRAERAKKVEAYEAIVAEYESVCGMADEKPISLPYSEEAAAKLTAETERLREQIFLRSEQSYISACVDEVMEEMEYDLIGSREVSKSNGKRFKNSIYSFGDGTAVSVTCSQDGTISVEVGGLSAKRREPTREERESLAGEMEAFCGEFDEFVTRLKAKGVIVKGEVTKLPPSAEYASIIGTEDYSITGEEPAHFDASNKSRGRKKRAAKKNEKKVKKADE